MIALLLAAGIVSGGGVKATVRTADVIEQASGTGAVARSQHAKNSDTVSAKDYGATGNGTTDDTAAIQAAIDALMGATGGGTGGTIYFPPGTYLVSGDLAIRNDGQASPKQPSLRLTGAGAPANGYWGAPPGAISALDLRGSTAPAKIVTMGAGKLEIDHLYLKDGGADSNAFILTTNTTLLIHDNTFSGTASGASAVNDGIILGGTLGTVGNTNNHMFQGYGTVIQSNWFDKIRRVVVLQSAANSNVVQNNTVSLTCGYTTGGAFEISGFSAGNTTSGNVFSNNLIEITNYKYGFNVLQYATGNQFIANSAWDQTATTTSVFFMGASTVNLNSVIAGFYADSVIPLVTESGTNSLQNFYVDPVNGVRVSQHSLKGVNWNVPGAAHSYQMAAGWPGQFDGYMQWQQDNTYVGGIDISKNLVWGGTPTAPNAKISGSGIVTFVLLSCTTSSGNCGSKNLTAGSATVVVSTGCHPLCSNTSSTNGVQCSVSGSTLTITGTGTDVINYLCF